MIFHINFLLFADCSPPPVVENAAVPVYSYTLLGSTATYSCNDGFVISGPEIINCLLSGWEAAPQCVTGKPAVFETNQKTYTKCAYASQ